MGEAFFPAFTMLCLLGIVRVHLAYAWSTRALGVLAIRIRKAIDAGEVESAEDIHALYQQFNCEIRPNRIIFDLTVWSYEKACPGY